MWRVALVFLLNLSVLASGKLDYCGARMCSHTNAHTFCKYSVGPSPQCIGYVDAPLSPEEKMRLVIRLNQRRAAVAKGRLRGFPTAGNMMKLLWIEELAREAQLWADQCVPPSTPEENDSCRDLYSVAVGQCAASVIGEAPGLRPESMVDIWYMQNMFYRGNITTYDPPVNNHYNYYGDFAQLVYSKTYMVGCGRSRFMVLMSGRLRSVERLVCNFAPRGPNSGRPLWTVASPGTACLPRSMPDDYVPELCVVQSQLEESYDPENMMSLEENMLLEAVFEVDSNNSMNYLGSLDEIYLTKLAMATIGDVVTEPLDYNSLQKRDLSLTSNRNNTDTQIEISTTTEQVVSIETTKLKPKAILIGRPKSYNIEDLDDDNDDDSKDDDNTEMEDLPIKAGQFEVDYEYKESSEESNKSSVGQPPTFKRAVARATAAAASTVYPQVLATTNTYELTYLQAPVINTTVLNLNKDVEQKQSSHTTSSQFAATTQMVTEFSVKNNINATPPLDNDTDAILEEYLSDPETVRQLQEELDRMEQAMSTETLKTEITIDERADKVRRALKDSSTTTYSDQIKTHSQESGYLDNSTITTQIPQMMQIFNESQNKTLNPMVSILMRYVPFLKNYKLMNKTTTLCSSEKHVLVYASLVLTLFLNNVLLS